MNTSTCSAEACRTAELGGGKGSQVGVLRLEELGV